MEGSAKHKYFKLKITSTSYFSPTSIAHRFVKANIDKTRFQPQQYIIFIIANGWKKWLVATNVESQCKTIRYLKTEARLHFPCMNAYSYSSVSY